MYLGDDHVANGIKNWSHDKLPDNQKTFFRYGVVHQENDKQYDQPMQARKPIDIENRHEEDDLRNVYNPNKKHDYNPNANQAEPWGAQLVETDDKVEVKKEGVPLWYNPADEQFPQPLHIAMANNTHGFKVRNSGTH